MHSEEIKFVKNNLLDKMKKLWNELERIYASFPVKSIALEEVFLGKNVRTMNILSQIRGVVIASSIPKEIPLFSYSPREVKLSVTGYGNAQKSQVKKMMEILLKTGNKKLGDDESDALAIAYCHSMKIK